MIYIYHHLGLGDHIICNGLVRELYKTEKPIKLFAKHHNANAVRFMFRDLEDLEVLPFNNDVEVEQYLRQNQIYNVFRVGHQEMFRFGHLNFDEAFYTQMGIDFSKRWDSFFVQRDLDAERKLFEKTELVEGEYIFLHDDVSRGYEINRKLIQSSLPVFFPKKGLTENIFDYLYLIENASEIHCMDSSFRLIIDSLTEVKTDGLFYHVYVRGNSKMNRTNSKLNWRVYE